MSVVESAEETSNTRRRDMITWNVVSDRNLKIAVDAEAPLQEGATGY